MDKNCAAAGFCRIAGFCLPPTIGKSGVGARVPRLLPTPVSVIAMPLVQVFNDLNRELVGVTVGMQLLDKR